MVKKILFSIVMALLFSLPAFAGGVNQWAVMSEDYLASRTTYRFNDTTEGGLISAWNIGNEPVNQYFGLFAAFNVPGWKVNMPNPLPIFGLPDDIKTVPYFAGHITLDLESEDKKTIAGPIIGAKVFADQPVNVTVEVGYKFVMSDFESVMSDEAVVGFGLLFEF